MNSKLKHRNKRPRISISEWLVTISASLTLAFTAWGYAGVIAWTVHVMLVGGLLTLCAAVWPRKTSAVSLRQAQARDASGEPSTSSGSLRERSGGRGSASEDASRAASTRAESPHSTTQPLNHSTTSASGVTRLMRWPPFWFSALFLLYLSIQAFNPSITVVRGEAGWWVEKMQAPLASWLPTSVRSDFEPMNAFRVLEWFTASFTLMWGIWAGITRRKTAIFILWALVLSGTGMALVAILQDLTEADKVLWTLKSANPQFWGSFFYRNQAAAYLNLMLIGIGFLYFYHAKNSAENGQSGGPHFLLFLFFALVAASIALALSRGGIIFGAVLSISFIGGVILQALMASRNMRSSVVISVFVALMMSAGAYTMIQQVDFEAIKDRFGDVGTTIENADQDARALSSKATFDMAKDKLWHGWGGGSFRYVFPVYQQNYPEIFYQHFRESKGGWYGRKVYYYAHNDILQFWAEYGVIGCGLLLLTFGTLLVSAFEPFSLSASSIVHCPLSTFHWMVGIATIIAHALVEFILNSPAYWVALVGLFVASAKLLQLEAARRQRGGRV